MISPTVSSFDKRNGKASTSEKTGAQVSYATTGLTLPILPKSYCPYIYNGTFYRTDNYRRELSLMRIDPTLSFLRSLAIEPVVAAEWSVVHEENAPEGSVEFIEKQIKSFRDYLVEQATAGCVDYGWQSFEKVYAYVDNKVVLDKIKPLLERITDILVNKYTGEYIGLRQYSNYSKKNTPQFRKIGDDIVDGTAFLKRDNSALFNINVEGTNWYGRPLMAAAIEPFLGWKKVNDAADRYDTKIAGSHFVVHYPYGVGTLDGVEVDNFEIARVLINNLEASGAITVPRHVDETIHELNKDSPDAWKVELLSDASSQQSNFVDRLKYYDNLKARALGFPERAVLEGSFGTKSEAALHADFAIVLLEARHQTITRQANNQIINSLMYYNYGRESVGTVSVKASPIADDTRQFLRELFIDILRQDIGIVLANLDLNELRERLGLSNLAAGQELSREEILERTAKASPMVNPGNNLRRERERNESDFDQPKNE